jgi:hypothetical protein
VRAALADINTLTNSSGGGGGGDEDGSSGLAARWEGEEGEGKEEEVVAACFMDGDLPVLALRTLLLAATDGHLVALVRCVLLWYTYVCVCVCVCV